MTEGLDRTKIFDANGQKYRVGLDQHGYVHIQPGWMQPAEDGDGDTFVPYSPDQVSDVSVHFDPPTAHEVAEYIESVAE